MGKKALVVDDDEYNLLLEKDLLEIADLNYLKLKMLPWAKPHIRGITLKKLVFKNISSLSNR
jgi:hypothetical protein